MGPKRKSTTSCEGSTGKKSKTSPKEKPKLAKAATKGKQKAKATEAKTTGKIAPKAAKASGAAGKLFTQLTDKSWAKRLSPELEKDYMKALEKSLDDDYNNKQIFPPKELIFNAFNLTPFDDVKLVILGQDPYHDDGQAMGLSFSVPEGIKVPPSLRNMYKELTTDIPGFKAPEHGCLQKWATQGILMLNATLTVEAHKPNSHAKYGWQKFTDHVIKLLSSEREKVVFVLWGGFAQKKEKLIDSSKHSIVKTAHPSPLSCTKFFGCKCFSQANAALKKFGKSEINWRL